MSRLVWCAVLVACGSSRTGKKCPSALCGGDGASVDLDLACDPVHQIGCGLGEKCTWVHDATVPLPLGHMSCTPVGAVPDGGRCTYGADGPLGYDDCTAGHVCRDGRCTTICELGGTCENPDEACVAYSDLFGNGGDARTVGVCNHRCDPLADNDFLGSGTRAGSACGSSEGCYLVGSPTRFVCASEHTKLLVQASPCSLDDRFANGCAQGYIPLVSDGLGASFIDCVALCAPGNAYTGNPSAQRPRGIAPHACTSTDARGTFTSTDACVYSWRLEYDGSAFVRSATSDTVGLCIDHATHRYDSNANGTLDGSDAAWPDCTTLPLGSAAAFGCVDTMTADTLPTTQLDVHLPHYLLQ